MTAVPPFLQSVFHWILEASWQASLLAIAVLLVQLAFRSHLNPRWRYLLWFLVLARLLVPALPESPVSVYHLSPEAASFETLLSESPSAASPVSPIPEKTPWLSRFLPFLPVVWLLGVLTLGTMTLFANRRFYRKARQSAPVTDPVLIQFLGRAAHSLNLKQNVAMVECSQIQSPAVMGLFRPLLLLPPHVRRHFSPEELHLIFLHELAHLKRGDLIVQWLMGILQILHWFNPVIWLAFRRIRNDRETATDALVLSRSDENERRAYGETLIKLLEHFEQRPSLPGLVGILEDRNGLKQRFRQIARFTRGAYGWSFLGLFLLAILAGGFLTATSSQNPPSPPPAVDAGELRVAAVNFNNVTLPEAFAFLQKEAAKQGAGLLIYNTVQPYQVEGVQMPKKLATFSLNLRDVPIHDIIRVCCALTETEFTKIENGYVIYRKGLPAEQAVAYAMLLQKCATLKLGPLKIRDQPFTETVKLLAASTRKADGTGVNFVVKEGPGNNPRVSLDLPDPTLNEVFVQLQKDHGIFAKVEPSAVFFLKGEDLPILTKVFTVPPSFWQNGAPPAGEEQINVSGRLKKEGVGFPAGTTAVFLPAASKLVVKNTEANLNRIALLLEEFSR